MCTQVPAAVSGALGRAVAAARPQRGLAWRLRSQRQRTQWALAALAGLAAASRTVNISSVLPKASRRECDYTHTHTHSYMHDYRY